MPKPLRAASIIRGYTWWLLKNNLGWDQDNYGGLVPIVPFSDEPQFNQYDFPYAVYGYTESPHKKLYDLTEGVLTFRVMSRHLSDINLASRVIHQGFKRMDESARDLNRFSTQISEYNRGITFTSTEIGYLEPGSPESADEGKVYGIISINYSYIDEFADQPSEDGIITSPSSFSL